MASVNCTRDIEIFVEIINGETCLNTGMKYNISEARASQIVKKTGKKLKLRMEKALVPKMCWHIKDYRKHKNIWLEQVRLYLLFT